jgi:gas vesicle protein
MKNISYILLGAAIGGIIALLFAPQSGGELRANIQNTAERDWARLQEGWQAEATKIHARLDQLQSRLQQSGEESEAGETA